jgi:hypothetical protein
MRAMLCSQEYLSAGRKERSFCQKKMRHEKKKGKRRRK